MWPNNQPTPPETTPPTDHYIFTMWFIGIGLLILLLAAKWFGDADFQEKVLDSAINILIAIATYMFVTRKK